MKKLTEFSVNYPVTILMMILGVILLGYISYDKLGVDLFPDLNSPRIFVEIKSGERPPEEMEKQFVENIEALAIRQQDVIQVTSITRVGTSQIAVEYSWNKDMDEAFLDLQKALNTLTQNQDLDELKITQHDPNTSPVMTIGLLHTEITDMNEIRKVAENYIRNELVRLEGVAEVEHDRLTPPGAGRELAAQLPMARFARVERSGHAPFLSHPDQVLAEVLGFLARHTVGAPA